MCPTSEDVTFEIGKLHHGLTYPEYHNAHGFRSSWLHMLKHSPAHFIAQKDDQKTTPALEFGKLFHFALENGERFMDLVKVEPIFTGYTQKGEPTTNPNSTDIKRQKAEWRESIPRDAIIVSNEDHVTLAGMLKAMSEHRLVKNIIKDGVRETSGFVKDPETGLTLKFRPDLITSKGHTIDYKSARDARYWHFYNDIFSDRPGKRLYILSAAHYSYCAKLMGLPMHDRFTYIAIEKTAPYGINVFPMDAGCLDYGETIRAPLMRLYAKCLQENTWPCYEEKAHPVSPPEWESTHGPDTEYLHEEDEDEA